MLELNILSVQTTLLFLILLVRITVYSRFASQNSLFFYPGSLNFLWAMTWMNTDGLTKTFLSLNYAIGFLSHRALKFPARFVLLTSSRVGKGDGSKFVCLVFQFKISVIDEIVGLLNKGRKEEPNSSFPCTVDFENWQVDFFLLIDRNNKGWNSSSNYFLGLVWI